jgi:hypothetical protein
MMGDIDRTKIPPHLRHLSEWRLRALFYLFRASV